MSATLFVLLPVGMIALVWSLCFVGCYHPVTYVSGFYQYQDTVEHTSGLVAFWPLNDTSGTTAVDLGPNHLNGTYTIGPDVPTYNAAQMSDASPGTYTLGQPNIVAGDTVGNNENAPNPCVYFDGGFVNIPGQTAFASPQFTIEAWVKPNWTLADAQSDPSNRVVVATASAQPSPDTGFALYASTGNLWTAGVGQGGTLEAVAIATAGNNNQIVQGSLYFLVVTYDGSTLALWVNPADTTQPPDGINNSASGYMPPPTSIPFFIGQGRPDLATPLFPFNGWIQDVAFYNVVLDDKTIATHYANGLGMQLS
jgi:hypothetical protein